MKKVSINELSVLTNKDRRTIKKHLEAIEPDSAGRYDSAKALQILYLGDGGPTYSEAMRRLAIARERSEREKEKKLRMENALAESSQITVQDAYSILEGSFIAVRERIYSSSMTDKEKEDLLLQLYGLRDADVCAIGREALLAEFQGKLSEVDTGQRSKDGTFDCNESR